MGEKEKERNKKILLTNTNTLKTKSRNFAHFAANPTAMILLSVDFDLRIVFLSYNNICNILENCYLSVFSVNFNLQFSMLNKDKSELIKRKFSF